VEVSGGGGGVIGWGRIFWIKGRMSKGGIVTIKGLRRKTRAQVRVVMG
jgi:hypothetical protein